MPRCQDRCWRAALSSGLRAALVAGWPAFDRDGGDRDSARLPHGDEGTGLAFQALHNVLSFPIGGKLELPMADFERLPVVVMPVLMARGFAAACSTSTFCWWCRRCWCCSWCWCRLPSRHCPVIPQCAFISRAATVAGRGRLTLLIGGKAAVGAIKVHHTPRIILSTRSSWKPVVEHDHANGEERQSHCLNSPPRHVCAIGPDQSRLFFRRSPAVARA